MDLVGIRTQFVRDSGRVDLVDDESGYGDNGADYYINAGIRYLDGRQDTPKTFAWYKTNIVQGDTGVVLMKARSIHEVWVADGDGRAPVEKKDLGWIRENYPEPVADIDQGIPLYWAPAVIGLSPEQQDLDGDDFAAMFDWDEIVFGEHEAYNGIVFMPPADGTYTVSILGRFASRLLEKDTDMNWWTIHYPELVIYAACRELEAVMRNRQGIADWDAVIGERLLGIERDRVRQNVAGRNEMKG